MSKRWTSEANATNVFFFFLIVFYVFVLKQGACCVCRGGNNVDAQIRGRLQNINDTCVRLFFHIKMTTRGRALCFALFTMLFVCLPPPPLQKKKSLFSIRVYYLNAERVRLLFKPEYLSPPPSLEVCCSPDLVGCVHFIKTVRLIFGQGAVTCLHKRIHPGRERLSDLVKSNAHAEAASSPSLPGLTARIVFGSSVQTGLYYSAMSYHGSRCPEARFDWSR